MTTATPYYLSLKVNSVPWLGGTTKQRMLRAGTGRHATEIATYVSEIKSGNKSMANTVETYGPPAPPPPVEYINPMNIMGTQCCGLHSLSGFQYHSKGKTITVDTYKQPRSQHKYTPVQLKAFVGAIQKTYAANAATNKRYREANDIERDAAYREGRAVCLPHPGYLPQPERRPALLLCTWNHKELYEPGARSLAKQIKDAGLGECTFTGYSFNINSGNDIAAMIWAINGYVYDRYVKENGL